MGRRHRNRPRRWFPGWRQPEPDPEPDPVHVHAQHLSELLDTIPAEERLLVVARAVAAALLAPDTDRLPDPTQLGDALVALFGMSETCNILLNAALVLGGTHPTFGGERGEIHFSTVLNHLRTHDGLGVAQET